MKKTINDLLLDNNGMDDRLKILDDGMTRYGCHRNPYQHISYSSCTASTISSETYMHIKDYLDNYLDISEVNNFVQEFQQIRDSIRSIFS